MIVISLFIAINIISVLKAAEAWPKSSTLKLLDVPGTDHDHIVMDWVKN